jgi:hypothetical protein
MNAFGLFKSSFFLKSSTNIVLLKLREQIIQGRDEEGINIFV